MSEPFWDGERFLMPISADEEDGDATIHRGRIFASPDGVTWADAEESIDLDAITDGLADHGSRIVGIGEIDGTLIGVGWVRSGDDERRSATFVRGDSGWTAQVVDGESLEYTFSQVVPVPDGLLAMQQGAGIGLRHWTIAADGTSSEAYRTSHAEQRALPLDLGGGALLAWGTLDRAADAPGGDEVQVGVGSCLWASADGGETWGATLVPGHNGRFCDMGLAVRRRRRGGLRGGPRDPARLPDRRGTGAGPRGGLRERRRLTLADTLG